MNKRKILTLALSICMIAILAVGGSLAYLIDEANATNVFTIGKVEIDLKESAVKVEGDEGEGTRSYVDNDGPDNWTVAGNKYEDLMPGSRVCKDPTVMNTGDNPAWIRVTIKHNNQDEIFTYLTNEEFLACIDGLTATMEKTDMIDYAWRLSNGTYGANEANLNKDGYAGELENNEKIIVMWMHDPLDAGENLTLFNSIQVPADFKAEEMSIFDGLNIDIKVEAIQADGLNNVVDAFLAYDLQVSE